MARLSIGTRITLPGIVSSRGSSCTSHPVQLAHETTNASISTQNNRKRVEVIADDEEQIIEASRRMVQNYDFVVTSGGIGPTHDGSCLIPNPKIHPSFTLHPHPPQITHSPPNPNPQT
jgi:3D (Asp-Asp-Asp) domain-containing protein